jgi:hypothetical protein
MARGAARRRRPGHRKVPWVDTAGAPWGMMRAMPRLSRAAPLLLTAVLAGCAAGPAAPSTPPTRDAAAIPAAPTLSAERLAFWRAVHEDDNRVPQGQRAEALVPELETMLSALDPAVRDDLAYSVFEAWILRARILGPEALRGLAERLASRLAAPASAGESDAVFGRSFAPLILALVARRELDTPFLDDAELAALLAALTDYAARETDLRGHVEGRGWAHAPAHTADALAVLARHPRLTAAQAGAILDAVLGFTVRRHGYNLHHGEDSRLAQPVLALVRRGIVDGPPLQAFLTALAAPLAEPWSSQFDPKLYAAQRNARNLLYTLMVALTLSPADDPHIAAAAQQVRATLGA